MLEFPHRHLSIRVPWHDLGWDGRVCAAPRRNDSCLSLTNIALHRNDEAEEKAAGCSLQALNPAAWPVCTEERGAFMAQFELVRSLNHPYAKTSPNTHGHIKPTPFRQPPYSAGAIPFRWMRTENMEELSKMYRLGVDPGLEPDLGFGTEWVQSLENQRALLDGFFRYVQPGKSLCFYYCKRVPFVEDAGRVIAGVGRAVAVGEPVEYEYRVPGLRCMIWDRAVVHSVRQEGGDGFLLPYASALARKDCG